MALRPGLRKAPSPPAEPGVEAPRRLLLASEGPPFPPQAVRLAARMARQADAQVRVLAIARWYGTGLGLPHPALKPSKSELEEQRRSVADAIRTLKRAGVEAEGHVVATRKGSKRIAAEAEAWGCEAIVMGADPPRSRLLADMMWSQEPQRVKRRAHVPVHLVDRSGG